jgi:iron(III) transport system permease protein
VLSGGALVLVSSMKELPVTLMLRPAGFDTLAVRIWVQASDGFYTQAAPSGLLIVIISLIPLYFLTKKEKGG